MGLSVRSDKQTKSYQPFVSPDGLRDPSLQYNRWSIPSIMLDQDLRQCRRRALRCKLAVIDPGPDGGECPVTIIGECLDISDGGLYAVVPTGHDLAVGQRYMFELALTELGPEPGTAQRVRQRGQIVRTELLMSEKGYQVGIGVHLLGPRTGVVPMPF
jgi:hypothetical protein